LANNIITISFTTDKDLPQITKDEIRQALIIEFKLHFSELKIPFSDLVVTVL
jgi:hypothetical protein